MLTSDPAAAARALADAEPTPYWLTDPARPQPTPALEGREDADLAVVGAGFTGLWTALIAAERDPGRSVTVLEGASAGWAASGRNGGFCSASLTHGFANGLARFEPELARLEQLGADNLAGIEATIERHGIDAEWERTGDLTVATQPWQLPELRELPAQVAPYGGELEFLDRDAVRAEVDSPTYLGGVWDRTGVALLHPAKLAWGLRRACLEAGVRIHERTPVRRLARQKGGLRLETPHGLVDAATVVLATSAFRPLVRRIGHYVVPVYDYVLVTEPLTVDQRAAIGWERRQGISDSANQFHYYRPTADGRILWGGYDAVYHYGNGMRPALDQRPETFGLLAQHFATTFPALRDVRFAHAWGGAIDTCTRFAPFWGTAYGGRLAYSVGYTGLGVGASRFGAQVALDLLAAQRTPLTSLSIVRSKPIPFPPEPARWAGIELTRRSLARADRREGRRDVWLRTLDRLGLGFDS